MKLLVTGFTPFGGESINPAWEAVRALPPKIAGRDVYTREVPTEFYASWTVLEREIFRIQPDAVLCVGQAGGRRAVTPERVAINVMDASIADNAGFAPRDVPVVPGAPAAYFSTLPIRAMAEAVSAAGLPAAISNTAGTFVCNSLMYRLLHFCAGTQIRGGFLHVPYCTCQVQDKPEMPAMELTDITRALTFAIAEI